LTKKNNDQKKWSLRGKKEKKKKQRKNTRTLIYSNVCHV